MYGPQFFDYKFTYTQTFLWSEPFFRSTEGRPRACARRMEDRSDLHCPQRRAAGRSATSTPTSRSAKPKRAAPAMARFSPAKYTGGTTAIYNVNVPNSATGAGINGNAANGGNNINMFSNPVATFNQFRPCILGYDTSCGSTGQIRGLSNWNMDMNVAKDINLFRERVSGTLSFQFVNVFNHVALADPNLSIASPNDWGVLGSNENGQLNAPRQLTFSLRLKF